MPNVIRYDDGAGGKLLLDALKARVIVGIVAVDEQEVHGAFDFAG